jgi:hypothetical protein
LTLHVYEILPIDFGWEHCPTVENYFASLAKEVFHGYAPSDELTKFKDDFERAQKLARQKGWGGDFRGDPHVFMVPVELEFTYAFAWKQDNNGTTFIVSPVELPHLKQLELFPC